MRHLTISLLLAFSFAAFADDAFDRDFNDVAQDILRRSKTHAQRATGFLYAATNSQSDEKMHVALLGEGAGQ